MRTLRAGLRAYCTNSRGAFFCTSSRHMPRGNFTSEPWTSAPAAFQMASASSSSRNSMPYSARIVSALRSMIDRPSSVRTSKYGIERVM